MRPPPLPHSTTSPPTQDATSPRNLADGPLVPLLLFVKGEKGQARVTGQQRRHSRNTAEIVLQHFKESIKQGHRLAFIAVAFPESSEKKARVDAFLVASTELHEDVHSAAIKIAKAYKTHLLERLKKITANYYQQL
ncbi:hypothetical protein NP233_g12557 [Leucocoprinus birnbaumii]|nr:hypothetical protein NP233_g12557 [Leucocoprinus birnbaumii]